MMVDLTYQMVLSTLQTLSLMIGIAYYIMVLHNQQKNQKLTLENRKASLFMQLYNTTINEEINRNWLKSMTIPFKGKEDDIDTSFGPLTEEVAVGLHTMWQKYNGIGHLLMQGLIDVESAYHYSEGWRAVLLWVKWKDLIIHMRGRGTNPDYMDGFQYMAERMMEYRTEKKLPNKIPELFTQ